MRMGRDDATVTLTVKAGLKHLLTQVGTENTEGAPTRETCTCSGKFNPLMAPPAHGTPSILAVYYPSNTLRFECCQCRRGFGALWGVGSLKSFGGFVLGLREDTSVLVLSKISAGISKVMR